MHAVARFEAAHPNWRRYQFQEGDVVRMQDGKVVRDDYTVELPDVKFSGSSKVVRADEEAAFLANGATLPQVPTIQKVVADAAQDYETWPTGWTGQDDYAKRLLDGSVQAFRGTRPPCWWRCSPTTPATAARSAASRRSVSR